ncbi:OLC1v1028384C1 [Oldenlandia corymbosa var. corymbosa]|uniref:OLC1v1028384C1 n=1 Tax=Oldenlandia corymbosa var. corymbosa TaxID=529605 RepID=A0AAV1CC34_OLDCO|nr:OLC1v1028384C1 [Oldenlandia corymbosa var. corymbosa]
MATKILTKPPPPPPTITHGGGDEETEPMVIEDVLTYPVLLSERIREATMEANSFKSECYSIRNLAENIGQMLRTTNRIATGISNGMIYERPIRRIVSEVTKVLEKTLTLVRKCKRGSILRRVMAIVSAADFRKLQLLLENSVADMSWLLNIFESGGGITLSLPPIASNDPIISWVWAFIASLYMGHIDDKIEAANELASLAKDNDRNKKYIVEEGGVLPLLKLLKTDSSVDAQIAAATTLFLIANDEEKVCAIINELGVPIIVQTLASSSMKVQILLASLVASMAKHSPLAQEDFARANVIRPVVTLLSADSSIEEPSSRVGTHMQSFHSVVDEKMEIFKERENNKLNRSPGLASSLSMQSVNGSNGGSSRGGLHKKERENEPPEVKLSLKTKCAEALWMLAKGSASNSKRITETKGLLCLARIVETEQGELLLNSLMAIMEITSAAESNADLRRAAFKTNSFAAKAVVDQLLRVIKEHHDPKLSIPAIRAIGFLARTFPARETRVIGPLVAQLSHNNVDVATEAAVALCKFACPENFLHVQHSKSIVEFQGVQPLLRLFKSNERAQVNAFVLLCYLAMHARNNETLEQPWVLTTLKGADSLIAQHHELAELRASAIGHLNVYNSGLLRQRPPYPP